MTSAIRLTHLAPEMRRLWAPALGALTLAACTTGPVYTYGPASYATPPSLAPRYEPIPVPLPSPAVTATPLAAPGQGAPTDLYASPADPYALPPSTFDPPAAPPPAADAPPAPPEPAAADPAPSDPVTDLLLMPQSQRDTAPAVVKKPSPPEANPLMGFRPMRGQTAPTP